MMVTVARTVEAPTRHETEGEITRPHGAALLRLLLASTLLNPLFTAPAWSSDSVSNNGANVPVNYQGGGTNYPDYGGDPSDPLPSGGNGSAVSVDVSGTIDSQPSGTAPVMVDVSGGKGGGVSMSGGFDDTPDVSGAPGGAAGTAAITSAATLTATGSGTAAISVNGSGGQGGNGGATGFVWDDPNGSGAGGAGGLLSLTLESGAGDTKPAITSTGDNAAAISISATGGNGGAGQNEGEPLGVEALGGSGGAGGTVTIKGHAADITTSGANAPALWIDASGGNGGRGGTEQNGAGGGAANAVTVDLGEHVFLKTSGSGAAGLYVSANGGAGGEGGSGGSLGSGGDGGAAGAGGTIGVTLAGKVVTEGNASFGIVAQAYAGTGGAGAGAVDPFYARAGAGGAGANGGAISITTKAGSSIRTNGAGALAILAQTVGGGGGNGGASSGLVSIGGDAGGSGNGGAVTLSSAGTLTTLGAGAIGLSGFSVGGGGGLVLGSEIGSSGDGGSAGGAFYAGGGDGSGGGAGGAVKIAPIGSITTSGSNAHAVMAQSIGGGGGAGGGSFAESGFLTITVGGTGGNGGSGGAVTVLPTVLDSSVASQAEKARIETWGVGAYGINALSVGGGGGDGGGATGAAFGIPIEGVSIAVSVAIGGNGGAGGVGGPTSVTNLASITTNDDDALGIYAASIGGGGGSGGAATAFSETPVSGLSDRVSVSASVAVAGTGDGGGDGGAVTVTNKGTVTTWGDQSYGTLLQSIGGGGGNGGNSQATSATSIISSLSTSAGAGKNGAVSVSLAGNAGGGGAGGTVEFTNDGHVKTHGNSADAVIAQSVGGGGGTGGAGAAYAPQWVAIVAGSSASSSVTLGGKGGGGGAGGPVTITSKGAISTEGSNSRGILAQSVGGGGGLGGGATSNAAAAKMQVDFSLGGSGGNGGAGGNVTVHAEKGSSIATKGHGSTGILAQSVGGGGGTGGSATAANSLGMANDAKAPKTIIKYWTKLENWWKGRSSVKGPSSTITLDIALGGSAGKGGAGGATAVTNHGAVTTEGTIAAGILAQSIGGGGGAGGAATGAGSSAGGTVIIGATGGAGGNGDLVSVTNTGAIGTSGNHAFGILAQSVGGGGGLGGLAADEKALLTGIEFRNGGDGGASGNGGEVDISNTGDITTSGAQSHALAAQSIGGGGGYAYLDGQTYVKSDLPESTQAPLYATPGVADNDGASTEGEAFSGLSISLGGSGGSGGNGGSVSIVNTGKLVTKGDEAFGIFAQSIGGGGGGGAIGHAATLSVGDVSYGPGGGNGGAGGAVTVTLGGDITTAGTGAAGVLAQSVGGGGGHIGGIDTALATLFLPTEIYSSPSSGSTGGNVTVRTNDAPVSITTTGYGAHGIFAQSAGGLGGSAATYAGLYSVFSASSASNGTPTAAVAGNVTVDFEGTIKATGTGSVGIYAEALSNGPLSVSTTDLPKIAVKVNGDVTGGSGPAGAGIAIAGGMSNTINIQNGTVSAGENGFAVAAAYTGLGWQANGGVSAPASDLTTLSNAGTISGNVDLGVGQNRFENSGTLNAGPWIVIDNDTDFANSLYPVSGPPVNGRTQFWKTIFAANQSDVTIGNPVPTRSGVNSTADTFVNAGTLNVAGPGTVGFSNFFVSNFTQQASATLEVDVNLADGQMDWIRMQTENAAVSLAGTVAPSVVALPQTRDPSAPLPGAAIFSVTGTPEPPSYNALSVTDSFVVDYALSSGTYQGLPSILLAAESLDFAPSEAGLSGTAGSLATYFQQQWQSGDIGDLGTSMVALANVAEGNSAGYAEMLTSLSPQGAVRLAAEQSGKVVKLADSLHSCPVFTGETAFLTEESCVWGKVTGGTIRTFSANGAPGYDTDTTAFRFGGQKALENDWFIGGSAVLGQSSTHATNGIYSSSTDEYGLGFAVKKRIDGAFELAASGSYIFSDIDQTRYISAALAGGNGDSIFSQPQSHVFVGRLRAAYYADLGGSYLKPYLDLDTIYTHVPGYSEQGASAYAADMGSVDDVSFGIRPGLEWGARVDLEGGTLRPFARTSVSWWHDRDIAQDARFSGASSRDTSFSTLYDGQDWLGQGALGFEYVADSGFEVRVQYEMEGNRETVAQSVTGRVGWRF
ncbi:autotransporter outer membrane beta-barrel domain-containing protein [Martelella limonii]|uniref:autotransporter outer membrane beta-barrel domain-containing protein n=1 Tax=Martelella limonii TaxID=1647649 RepID=UPI0015811C58|nr:autotransporter outer membrane beta-barrel domain-containing protein [Martelella limonii]